MKADLETMTWVQVFYLGGDPRKHRKGYGERETGKGDKPTKAVLMSRQLRPNPQGGPIEHSAMKGYSNSTLSKW